jgi:hypothetical protein
MGLSIIVGSNVLSAQAKSDLKLTSEKAGRWNQEKTVKVNATFDENTTYITWSLVDTLHLVKVSIREYLDSKRNHLRTVTKNDEKYFNVIVGIYMDKIPNNGAIVFQQSLKQFDNVCQF